MQSSEMQRTSILPSTRKRRREKKCRKKYYFSYQQSTNRSEESRSIAIKEKAHKDKNEKFKMDVGRK